MSIIRKLFKLNILPLLLAILLAEQGLASKGQDHTPSSLDEVTERALTIYSEEEDKPEILEAYQNFDAYRARALELKQNIDLKTQEISQVKKEKSGKTRYEHFYYWLLGHVLGGTENKYLPTSYPKNSLYNTLTEATLENYARLTSIVYSSSKFDKFTSLKSNKGHLTFLKNSYRIPVSLKEDVEDYLYELYLFSKEINLQENDSKKIQSILETLSKLQQIELIINYLLKKTAQLPGDSEDEIKIETIKETLVGLTGEEAVSQCRCKTYNDFLTFLHKYFSEQEIMIRKELFSMVLKYNIYAVNFKNQPIFNEEHFNDYKIVSTFFRNQREFSGFSLYSKKHHELLIVFAGSKSTYDWLQNIQFWGTHGDANLRLGSKEFILHKGFTEIFRDMLSNYDRIMAEIQNEIAIENESSHCNLKVTVLGHSLGGAISSLVAYYFKSHLLTNYGYKNDEAKACMSRARVSNLTFGSPRFVNHAGAKIIEDTLGKGNILRFWNTRDLVPAIVLNSTGRKHVGVDIPLPDSFWYELTSPFVAHHTMDRYWALSPHYFGLIKKESRETLGLNERVVILEDVKKRDTDELLQVNAQIQSYQTIFKDLKAHFPQLALPH